MRAPRCRPWSKATRTSLLVWQGRVCTSDTGRATRVRFLEGRGLSGDACFFSKRNSCLLIDTSHGRGVTARHTYIRHVAHGISFSCVFFCPFSGLSPVVAARCRTRRDSRCSTSCRGGWASRPSTPSRRSTSRSSGERTKGFGWHRDMTKTERTRERVLRLVISWFCCPYPRIFRQR